MNPFIDRLKLLFLGLFFIATVAVWYFQLFWVLPARKCESHGGWWDHQTHICATPLYLPNLTGRPAGTLSPAALKARAQQANADLAKTLPSAAPATSAKPAGTP